jgi:hypothetical protein
MSKPFPKEVTFLAKLVGPEAFLVQLVVYLLLWLWNDYLATILSLVLGGISLAVFLIAKLVELVESSRVPGIYYRFMVICFIAPLVGAILGIFLRDGLSWLK